MIPFTKLFELLDHSIFLFRFILQLLVIISYCMMYPYITLRFCLNVSSSCFYVSYIFDGFRNKICQSINQSSPSYDLIIRPYHHYNHHYNHPFCYHHQSINIATIAIIFILIISTTTTITINKSSSLLTPTSSYYHHRHNHYHHHHH